MVDLTEAQRRVLDYVDYFSPSNPNNIRADLRDAFWELEKLGLIAAVVQYRLTDAGRELVPDTQKEPS